MVRRVECNKIIIKVYFHRSLNNILGRPRKKWGFPKSRKIPKICGLSLLIRKKISIGKKELRDKTNSKKEKKG